MEFAQKDSDRSLQHAIEGLEDGNVLPFDLSRDLPAKMISLPKPTSFLTQLYWTLYKNMLVVSRRPVMLFLMLFGSIFSTLLAWAAAGQENADDSILRQLDDCGTIPLHIRNEMYRKGEYDIQDSDSLNEAWRTGFPVAVLSLGPFVQAACAFLIVQSEIEKKMLGVLRALGVRDSVYWLSWYLPFLFTSLVNALLGAGTAKFLPVHVFEAVYFGGIFGSLFFLQLSLVAASLFLAAVCGSLKRLIVMIIAVMIVAVFFPAILVNITALSQLENEFPGLFWSNGNTTSATYDNIYAHDLDQNITWDDDRYWDIVDVTLDGCERPIFNEEIGNTFKLQDPLLQSDDFFVGCYKDAGFATLIWNPIDPSAQMGLATLFFVPYFHFMTMFSNFAGFTSMPNRTFTAAHANVSPEGLAIASLPSSMNEENGKGSSMFPQGSTFITRQSPPYLWGGERWETWMKEQNGLSWDNRGYYGDLIYPIVCPSQDFNQSIGINLCDLSYSCNYVPDNFESTDSPSVNDMMGYQCCLVIMYLLLASYWIQVFPAGNGAREKFYFFFSPSYWFGSIGDVKINGDAPLVEISNISKKFNSFQAVKNFSLTLKGGEVTALLGHNGAGKSTVINILTCEMPLSSGEVSIFGKSITDTFAVRQFIGVCKQDDYLWPNLTAKEHLDIFGGLRGLDPAMHDSIVQKWLESVDLTLVKDKNSAAFSGGMKRRLSVALATIGDRPLVILDEPTTGMDPVSRRYVWKHLDEIKDRRVVLITTHAMEEADLLADEVAIMKKGELAAKGTPLELKSEYGAALQFSLLVEKGNVEKTESSIKEMLRQRSESISLTSSPDSGNITVKFDNVDDTCTTILSNFVSWLESDDSHVTEYGFSNSSLEEVFMAITKDDHDEDSGTSPTHNIATPVDEIFGVEDVNSDEFDPVNHVSEFQPRLNIWNQVVVLIRQNFVRKYYGKRSIGEYIFFSILVVISVIIGFMAVESGTTGLILIQSFPTLFLSLMLPSIVFPFYHDKQSGMLHLMRTQGLLGSSFILGSAFYAFAIQFLYGLILLLLYYATPIFRETQMCENAPKEQECYTDWYGYEQCYSSSNWCWERGFTDPLREYGSTVPNLHDENVNISAIRTPGGGLGTIILVTFLFALSTVGASFSSSIIPGNYKFAMVAVTFCALLASFAPLATIVNYFYQAYFDHYSSYYSDDETNSFFDRCRSILDPLDLCDKISDGPDELILGEDITSEYYMTCMGLNLNQEMFLALCIPPYASLLPQFGVVQLLSMTLASRIKFSSDEPGYIENVFIPENFHGLDCTGDTCMIPKIQSLYRENALYFFLGAIVLGILGFTCFTFAHFTPKALLPFKLSCSRTIAKIIEKLCCKSNEATKNETAFSEEVILSEVIDEKEKVSGIIQPLLEAPSIEMVEDGEQLLPINRKSRIESHNLPPVVMHNLRKVYPSSGRAPPKVALNSLDLHVPEGQVLGLLGKNGSGKSTCLKILSGNQDRSGGVAFVAGYDVSNESSHIFGELGSCPQFDITWPNLSVKEHLIFFAGLKGLPKSLIKKAAHDVAKAVGLGDIQVYERNAGQLSGGMRRRLSIAISVLGAPKVLFLDEPTTGLDPSTRTGIWNLIGAFATDERAVIITTHMMIEADTLCNRIAIIAEGNLRVVATQQQLKDKYGSGYTLQLNLVRSSQAHQDMAMRFVHTYINEDATLVNKQAKTLHVSLPRDQSIGKVFKAMYSPERTNEGGINQFLLQQSSLEDVFITLG